MHPVGAVHRLPFDGRYLPEQWPISGSGTIYTETHLATDSLTTYQIPLTYRGQPLGSAFGQALIAVVEHSALGARWIYDATADPVWIAALLHLVNTGGQSDPSSKRGVGPAQARGVLVTPQPLTPEQATIEVQRALIGLDEEQPGDAAAGIVTGSCMPKDPTGRPLSAPWPESAPGSPQRSRLWTLVCPPYRRPPPIEHTVYSFWTPLSCRAFA
jgi:hypothetical protein